MPFPARGKIPEYPRPVPTISTEEIPVCASTIVHEEWTDKAENESEERAAKRRKRIEDCAIAYLRGDPVLIMSAQLKGPFGDGWRNPWKRKRQIAPVDRTEAEVPETVFRKAPRRRAGVIPEKRFGPPRIQETRPSLGTKRKAIDDALGLCRERRSSPFRSIQTPKESIVLKDKTPASARRVEDWLKTNDDYPPQLDPGKLYSPIPLTNFVQRELDTPGHRYQTGSKEQEILRDAQDRVDDKPSRPTSGNSEAEDTKEQHSRSADRASSAAENKSRAEFAILESKRRSLQTAPASTTLPAFEYRRGGRQPSNTSTNQPSEPRSAAPGSAAEIILVGPKANPKSGLATETSKASTVNSLPSAQVAPVTPLYPTVSNIASMDNLLEEIPPKSTNEGSAMHAPSLSTTLARPQVAETDDQSRGTTSTGPPALPDKREDAVTEEAYLSASKIPSTAARMPREPDTQEMLEAIQPFDFSTAKKSATNLLSTATPVTATKVRPKNVKKRASFADNLICSESSHASIKASMKVVKSTNPEVATAGTPSASKLDQLGLDKQTSDEEGPHPETNLPSFSSIFATTKTGPLKSILKSSTMLSSAAAPTSSNNIGSTSVKQDAQRVSEPFVDAPAPISLNDGENFDLDAAIDDLGSYLGTWDAEKEASGLLV